MNNFIGSANYSASVQPPAYFKKMRKEFGEHTWVKRSPEDVVSDYIISKGIKAQPDAVIRLRPGGIRARISTELRSLETANNRLANSQEIHRKKRMVLQKEMNIVKELLTLLRDRHLAFEEFVKENQEKRERVLKNTQGRVSMRQTEIDTLQNEITRAGKIKKMYDNLLRKYKLYEHYLNKVVAKCPGEFRDCDALIRRHEAISEARDMCNKKHKQDIVKMEECLTHLQQKNLVYKMEILGLRNRFFSLSKQYGIAHNKSLLWENTVQKVQDAVMDGQKERTQIGEACWNLYVIMCLRQNSKVKVSQTNMNDQIVKIKNSLLKGAKILSTVNTDFTSKRRHVSLY